MLLETSLNHPGDSVAYILLVRSVCEGHFTIYPSRQNRDLRRSGVPEVESLQTIARRLSDVLRLQRRHLTDLLISVAVKQWDDWSLAPETNCHYFQMRHRGRLDSMCKNGVRQSDCCRTLILANR